MTDLRDGKVVRSSYLSQLIDSNQLGYLVTFGLFLMVCYFAWKWYQRKQDDKTLKFTPYKVLKSPSSMVTEQSASSSNGERKKRVCAVIGATGFVGGHLVDELVRRKEHYVFCLGRKFKPEKTNPDVDCVIQVDLMDLEGLTRALQGVDSVFNAAAILPTVFDTADISFSRNRLAYSHLITAAKKAGVKNLVHLAGFRPKNKIKDPVFAAFMNALHTSKKDIIEANGEDGLQTCVVAPTNIVGLNSPYFDKILSGEMKSTVMPDQITFFVPVDYLVRALANVEEKMATPSSAAGVVGKMFYLRGEAMSWKTLFSLPGWPYKIAPLSRFTLRAIIKTNVICATLFGWAPFGAVLSSGILEIFDYTVEEIPEEELQAAYEVLAVGPPNPPIAEYVKQMVDKYRLLKEDKKEKEKKDQ